LSFPRPNIQIYDSTSTNGLCAVSRWREGRGYKSKVRLNSALDRSFEQTTADFQLKDPAREIDPKRTIIFIFQYDMAAKVSVNPR
jgi:hypothetical protein